MDRSGPISRSGRMHFPETVQPEEGGPEKLSLNLASRTLLGIGAAFLIIMIAAIVGMTWRLHDDALADARQNLDTLGVAVAEQTSQAVQGADVVLEQLRTEFRASGIATPQQFAAQLGFEATQKMLLKRREPLSQIDAFILVGADGKLLNYSRQWPILPTDIADRDYYKYFRDHDDPSPFISIPVQNRTDGNWTSYLARRINGPNGVFLGIVAASLHLPYYEDFYRTLAADTGTAVTLLRRDGVVLTAFPAAAKQAGQNPQGGPQGAPWQRTAPAGPGTGVSQGPPAAEPSIISVHPLSDYPLVVDVSITNKRALFGWRRIVVLAVAVALSAVAFVTFLLRALFLQLRRLERSESSLAQQNAELGATQHRLQQQASALLESESRLAQQSSALETTLGNMNQGIMMVSADLIVQVCNRRAIEMLDLPPALMAGRPSFAAVVAHQRSMDEFAHLPLDAQPTIGEARVVTMPQVYERRRPNGRILEIHSIPLRSGGMVRTYSDITQRRQSEEQVRYLAHHDGLTGLVNRSVFQVKLTEATDLAARGDFSVAVLYLDLDGFKLINDTYGHAVGDSLLIEVSTRLQNAVREIDTVARMGGDEFAIIQPLVENQQASHSLAIRILAAMSEPYVIGDIHCNVGLSIGIALYPDHAASAEELLRQADIALYRAKAGGKGMFCVFDLDMDLEQQRLHQLEQDLVFAMTGEQFFIEYQAIVDTRTRQVSGFEALLRWTHPTRGLIGPDEFITMAEASGQIVALGLWVLETACAEARSWPAPIRLSVNLSPLQFKRGDLPEQIAAVLQRTGFDSSRLSLEVTEGLLLDDTAAVLDAMFQLRRSGVCFSLDDFGTAHSGLAYLRRFPFDIIKIDKSFVQDATEQPEARAIVAAVLAIGKAFGLSVIAEGVETNEQLELMHEMGCGLVQGFLTGRPMPAEQILGRNSAYAQ